jgi:type II secretory pathway pseudopilin PulG
MDETKAADEKAPKRRRAAWWAEILIAVAIVLIVVGIVIPGYNFMKAGARRGEARANLYEIQKAVERFAVDTGGTYPEYLIGGSAPRGNDPKQPFAQASDPLLRKGYLTAYPRNPFVVQQTVKAMQEQYKDPFRPGIKESQFGYRFGEDYTLMGQVLADFRYPKLPGQKMTDVNGLYCYADTEYPFWDIWPKGAKKPRPFLPGDFFYKSMGTIVIFKEKDYNPDLPIVPTIIEFYMLGLYGGPRDRGKDILGPEPNTVIGRFNGGPNVLGPAWTRSTRKPNKNGDYCGSPYGPPNGDDESMINYGASNGIPDAIILVLVPGEDTRGPQ